MSSALFFGLIGGAIGLVVAIIYVVIKKLLSR
jgi:biopolymer transport protein ExbB/TolQ